MGNELLESTTHGGRPGAPIDDKPATPRPLYMIARDIRATWVNKAGKPSVNYAAKPYLDAMAELNGIGDKYFLDSAAGIVRYFLANATHWRGDDARRIKAELKAMLESPDASRTA